MKILKIRKPSKKTILVVIFCIAVLAIVIIIAIYMLGDNSKKPTSSKKAFESVALCAGNAQKTESLITNSKYEEARQLIEKESKTCSNLIDIQDPGFKDQGNNQLVTTQFVYRTDLARAYLGVKDTEKMKVSAKSAVDMTGKLSIEHKDLITGYNSYVFDAIGMSDGTVTRVQHLRISEQQ